MPSMGGVGHCPWALAGTDTTSPRTNMAMRLCVGRIGCAPSGCGRSGRSGGERRSSRCCYCLPHMLRRRRLPRHDQGQSAAPEALFQINSRGRRRRGTRRGKPVCSKGFIAARCCGYNPAARDLPPLPSWSGEGWSEETAGHRQDGCGRLPSEADGFPSGTPCGIVRGVFSGADGSNTPYRFAD